MGSHAQRHAQGLTSPLALKKEHRSLCRALPRRGRLAGLSTLGGAYSREEWEGQLLWKANNPGRASGAGNGLTCMAGEGEDGGRAGEQAVMAENKQVHLSTSQFP